MPIYKTDGAGVASAIGQVTFGSQTIGKVYFGSTLVFEGTQVFDLTSGVNVNVETFLTGQAASLTSPVIINIASDQVIGSNSAATPALVTGDLSGYTYEPTINNAGEIQGAASGDAINATSNITINNTGAIRGGGGNGGNGGLGGYGMTTTSQTYQAVSPSGISCLSDHNYMWIYGPSNPPECATWWGGVKVFNATYTFYTKKVGDKWYWPGGGSGGQYDIWRGTHADGTKGAGGAGGLGQGYNQARTDGAAGGLGVNRAGNGGSGGDGGAWGVAGSNGGTGGAGKYYSDATRNTLSAGAAGTAGAAAGKAIDSGTATVTLLGDGVVNGEVE